MCTGASSRSRLPLAYLSPTKGARTRSFAAEELGEIWRHVETVDLRFVVWLASRNARTSLSSPQRLHEGEICHPVEQSIALGEPALSQGLIAAPAWLVTRDPIATYNFAVAATMLFGAWAMDMLVHAWTGDPAAALLAAIAYGFHPLKISDPVHFYIPDTAWTVWALLFFYRFLEKGRWRHVVLLGRACAMQIGGSLYPLLGVVALALPFSGWALHRFGVRETKPVKWLALIAWIGCALAFAFTPYLAKAGSGALADRAPQFYAAWGELFGGGQGGLGLAWLLLAASAFVPARRAAGPESLRWLKLSLLAGFVLCLLLANGGNQDARMVAERDGLPVPMALPNLFAALAAVLPGLAAVRLPGEIVQPETGGALRARLEAAWREPGARVRLVHADGPLST